MPVPYQNVSLYKINEITGPLRQKIGRNPTARIVEDQAGDWLVEVRNGIAQSPTLLGYLYDGTSNVPSRFASKKAAADEVVWASEFLVVELPQ